MNPGQLTLESTGPQARSGDLSTEPERPQGIRTAPDVLTVPQERELLERFETLRWEEISFHGQVARRTARHFGLGYDYQSRVPLPGDQIPDWLEPPRRAAAALAQVTPESLVEILVQRYPPGAGIGWHRDAPAFGLVVGLSLHGPARLRLRRGRQGERRTWEVRLEPRSGYLLADEARWRWEHSIPPGKELRYSITFRTLRDPG